MTKRIKVAVSPFYGGTEWTDEFTGVTFKKNVNGMNVYSIPADSDMTGIAAAIRLNALILFEGEISEAHTEAGKTYQEPGRWTEYVVKKTEPVVPEVPPVVDEGTEPGGGTDTGEGDETGAGEVDVPDPTEPNPEVPGDTEPETPVEPADDGTGEGSKEDEVQPMSLDETPEYETVNPDDMTVEELKAHTEKYNIPVEGTGSNGNAVKADYIAAIKAYQE